MSQPEYSSFYPIKEPESNDRRLTVVDTPTPRPTAGQRFRYRSGEVLGRHLDEILNEYGKEGWQLRVCVPNKTPAGYPDGTFFVLLERRLSPTSSDTPA